MNINTKREASEMKTVSPDVFLSYQRLARSYRILNFTSSTRVIALQTDQKPE